MSILIIDKRPDMETWVNALQTALPNETIEVYPTVKDPEKIEFLICRRPERESVLPFKNIKVIQCMGAGVNGILEIDILDSTMTLARVVDPCLTNDMFEFVVSIIFPQMKNLPTYAKQQEQKIWKQLPYQRIENVTIAVLGLGKIGGSVATRLAVLGFKVKGWSNSPKNLNGVESFVGIDNLKNCLTNTNYLINLLPSTPATYGILNKENLQYLTKGAFVINVGRGTHNNEVDLIELLDSGHLSGLFSDVFHKEPLPQLNPFWTHSKVIVTPHTASISNPVSVSKLMAANYNRFRAGLPLENVVEVEKGY